MYVYYYEPEFLVTKVPGIDLTRWYIFEYIKVSVHRAVLDRGSRSILYKLFEYLTYWLDVSIKLARSCPFEFSQKKEIETSS